MPHEIKPDDLKNWLPPRPRDSHKGDFGNVGILGGAPGMAGAALLAGRAALRLGAGRVYIGLLDDRLAFDPLAPELMVCSPDRLSSLSPPGCLVVGPGLGTDDNARSRLQTALTTPLPLILDADALNLIAADAGLADQLRTRHAATLLTPHPGEAARLLAGDTDHVQADRTAALAELIARFGCGVILKGAGTLIGFPDRPAWINTTGNPGMAAPGMGDVLAGMIAALAAQGLALEQAAVLAVHLHGAAGDRLAERLGGPIGLAAGEIADAARQRLNEWVYPPDLQGAQKR